MDVMNLNRNVVINLTDRIDDILRKYDHPNNCTMELVEKHLIAKQEINLKLGLNSENDYRLIFTIDSDDIDILNKYKILKDINKMLKYETKYHDNRYNLEISWKDNIIHYNKDINGIRKKFNQKITKVLGFPEVKEKLLNVSDYICQKLDINTHKLDGTKKPEDTLYNAFITKIGEIGNSIGLSKRKLVISSNICDMLTSSTNSEYDSCYGLEWDDDNECGCHSSGLTQYILDQYSIIAFIAEENSLNNKIGRIMVFLNPENEYRQFLTGREYGNFDKNLQEKAGKIISEILGNGKLFAENWKSEDVTIGREIDNPLNIGGSGTDSGPGYFDSYMVNWYIDGFNSNFEMKFPDSFCLACGNDYTNNKMGLTCSNCKREKYTCQGCGCGINADELYANDYGMPFCESCYNEIYTRCWRCENEIRVEFAFTGADEELYCECCHDRLFQICDSCDQVTDKDDICYDPETHDHLCQSCFEEREEEREAEKNQEESEDE